MPEAQDLITVREAARECRRTPETVRRWVWEGKLPAQKLGNQLFVRRAELRRILSNLRGEDAATAVAALQEAAALRGVIRQRIGGNLDVLGALDRSRRAHP